MSRSFTIASINGTSVRLHWSFVLLLSLIGLAVFISAGPGMAADIILLICLMFFCILLHEFGHITVARHFGIQTPEVMLLPIGGLAKLEHIPSEPGKELAIAIAGPLVNFVLFALMALALGRWPDWASLNQGSPDGINILEHLAIFNLVVGLFNLLPAFPMDGGRILRSLLALALPQFEATKIATRAGQLMAIALGILALVSGNILLGAISIFIFLAASSEARIARMKHAIGGLPVAHIMVGGQPRLAINQPLSAAADAILHSDSDEFPVFDAEGELIGIILRPDIIASLRTEDGAKTVGETMRRDIPMVSSHFRADKAAEMIAQGAPIIAVLNNHHKYAGIVNWRNLLDAMEIDAALRRKKGELSSRVHRSSE